MANVADTHDLLQALKRSDTNGSRRFPCPLCGARKSVAVKHGHDGRTLVHCHAGRCDVFQWAKRQGGLSSDRGRATPKNVVAFKPSALDEYERTRKAYGILRAAALGQAGQPVEYLRGRGITIVPDSAAVLDAHNALHFLGRRYPAMVLPIHKAGKLVGAQVTFLSKDGTRKLKSRRAVRWSYGPIGGGYVPLGPTNGDQPLVIGEGVETTLSAMQLTGFSGIATLGTSGMVAVQVPKCSEAIIAADNDDAGKKAAESLARRLAIEGRKVRIAYPPGSTGQDWNDALQSGEDVSALGESLRGARRVEPDEEVRPLTVQELMAISLPERSYLLKPWLPVGGLVMVHAQRGNGKTWFVLSAAHAVATGSSFMEWECAKRERVLYVDGELPLSLLRAQYLAHLHPDPDRRLKVLAHDLYHLQHQVMPDLGTAAGRSELDAIIERVKPRLIVLDSLSTLMRSGVENDADAWMPIQQWLLEHRWRGRTVLLVHHEGRNQKPRGTSKREDVLDTIIAIKKREPGAGEKPRDNESSFELTFTKSRGFYGKEAEPVIVRLSTASGVAKWRMQAVKQNTRARVAALLKQGLNGSDIAKEVGITQGRVSQLRKELGLSGIGRWGTNEKAPSIPSNPKAGTPQPKEGTA